MGQCDTDAQHTSDWFALCPLLHHHVPPQTETDFTKAAILDRQFSVLNADRGRKAIRIRMKPGAKYPDGCVTDRIWTTRYDPVRCLPAGIR